MDIFVVTERNKSLYEDIFDAYLRERHLVYADELGWVPPSPDERETDAFDTDKAVHLIGVEDGEVIAASRLVPTSEPHLLSENFAHLCDGPGGLVRRPDVAEWTRGFVVRRRREVSNFRIHFQFCHAVMEYALQEGLAQLGGIQRTYWLPLWKRMGWRVHVHGTPIAMPDGDWLPAYLDVTEEALSGAARWGKVSRSLLVQGGPYRPFLPEPEVFAAAAATEINVSI